MRQRVAPHSPEPSTTEPKTLSERRIRAAADYWYAGTDKMKEYAAFPTSGGTSSEEAPEEEGPAPAEPPPAAPPPSP